MDGLTCCKTLHASLHIGHDAGMIEWIHIDLVNLGIRNLAAVSCSNRTKTVSIFLETCSELRSFMEETGAQVTARWMRWAYFARPAELGEFELYSDRASRLKYMKRLMQFVGTVTAANLYIGLYNMWLLFGMGSGVNVLGFLNLLIGVFGAVGLWKMYKGYKALQAEGELFE